MGKNSWDCEVKGKKTWEKDSQIIKGKEGKIGYQHFLAFSTIFSSISINSPILFARFGLLSVNSFNMIKTEILFPGKDLTRMQQGIFCVVRQITSAITAMRKIPNTV